MYKACIFDLDGTLVNSLDDLADSCNYALEKMGFAVTILTLIGILWGMVL